MNEKSTNKKFDSIQVQSPRVLGEVVILDTLFVPSPETSRKKRGKRKRKRKTVSTKEKIKKRK